MNKLPSNSKNSNLVRQTLILVVTFSLVIAIIIFIIIGKAFPLPDSEELLVHYLKEYITLIQIIIVGVVVTLISVIIPMILPEAKDKFERYKQSRHAYSRAKTAVLYLADKILDVDDRKKAFEIVEATHRELHLAETFKDMIIDKKYLNWFEEPKLWITYNYWQITAVVEVLRRYDSETFLNKKKLKGDLFDMLNVVHSYFGKWGKNCEGKDEDTCNEEIGKEIQDKLKN